MNTKNDIACDTYIVNQILCDDFQEEYNIVGGNE